MKNLWKIVLLTIFLSFISSWVDAQTIKVAVLAPEGTSWAKSLKKMVKEVKTVSEGKVIFKIYFGGSQGDEGDVLRKIRVGQLHGGIFTGKTLGDINGDVRVMEIPFTFNGNRAKALDTLYKVGPSFNKGFENNEFVNLGFLELGMVYFVSQKKTPDLDSLRGLKIWSWEGDQIVSTMIKKLGLISVPLPLPDVLSSLTTGILEAAYAPPMGIIALQWNTKVKYLVDFPLAYSIGAFLISSKQWNKISAQHRSKIQELATSYLKDISESNDKENREGLEAMKKMGVEFINFSQNDINKAKDVRQEIVEALTGKLFSKQALTVLEKRL